MIFNRSSFLHFKIEKIRYILYRIKFLKFKELEAKLLSIYRHHKERIKFVSRLKKNASPTLHNNEYSPNHNQKKFINSQKVIDQIKDSIPPAWWQENKGTSYISNVKHIFFLIDISNI